ncbi:MAG: DUF2254 family protein, partial [Maribacter sp.]
MLSILRRIYTSISFLTFCIAISFALLAVLLIQFSPNTSTSIPAFSITDKEQIQFILTFTIGGIFTLTVFSYTMVMNVLNRNISNYSPRLIPLILHERYHQVILGTTSGTINYSLVLALYISNDKHELPAIAAPLAIFFVIVCVLLFIYFIHKVSQSIHVNYIIRKSFDATRKGIQKFLDMEKYLETKEFSTQWETQVALSSCGYLNKIRLKKLLRLSAKEGIHLKFIKSLGSFCLENEPVVAISEPVGEDLLNTIKNSISIARVEPIDVVEIVFKHLGEVAVKASSPAINDPGTALLAIDYLTQLLILYNRIPAFNCIVNRDGGVVFLEIIPITVLKEYIFKEME